MPAETNISNQAPVSPAPSAAAPRLWSAVEIADATGLTLYLIRMDMKTGLLPYVLVGRGVLRPHLRVTTDNLRAYARRMGLADPTRAV